jgi:hypothetical protein
VAGLNFFWQLGSSSYFTDEAFSVLHSLPSLDRLIHLVNTTETRLGWLIARCCRPDRCYA